MIPGVFERLLASLLFTAIFAVLVKSIGFFGRRRARKQSVDLPLPAGATAAEPTLLYFWSTGCSQCTPQERQIEQAQAALLETGKAFTLLKVNALEEHQMAKKMHVMTVPTTVLVDLQGKVAARNPGLTPWRKIVEQYHNLSA
jgi:hypothetical protein